MITLKKGYGKALKNLLSKSGFRILSRLTYSAYLMFPIVVSICLSSLHNSVLLTFSFVLLSYARNTILSFITGFMGFLVIEGPVLQMRSNLAAKLRVREVPIEYKEAIFK